MTALVVDAQVYICIICQLVWYPSLGVERIRKVLQQRRAFDISQRCEALSQRFHRQLDKKGNVPQQHGTVPTPTG